MVPEGEERGGKFEDLFEDLDKFFAQGNPGPGRRGSGASGANEEEPAEDLLPPGWEPDIEGLDLGSDQGADARPRKTGPRRESATMRPSHPPAGGRSSPPARWEGRTGPGCETLCATRGSRSRRSRPPGPGTRSSGPSTSPKRSLSATRRTRSLAKRLRSMPTPTERRDRSSAWRISRRLLPSIGTSLGPTRRKGT